MNEEPDDDDASGGAGDRPGDAAALLGRLVESTVYVNDAHPAYLRAAASRAEGYLKAPPRRS